MKNYIEQEIEAQKIRKAILPAEQQETCLCCGANHIGGLQGCIQVYQHLSLEFGVGLVDGVGRGIFDGYCMQHPEIYCVSAKSMAAHLAFLACWIDYKSPLERFGTIRRGLDGEFKQPKAPILEFRGSLTIQHLQKADSQQRYAVLAREWLLDIWQAYTPLHDLARDYENQFYAIGKRKKP
jgi:Family of unknown function (DUF5946)